MMQYLWLHCEGRYGRKKPNTSFWGILLVSVMSGEAITKEACVFAEKLPKHGLTFCRNSVLELCSLATEGTQEFGFWKESGICNTHHKTSFAYYRRDARIPIAKRFCRFATMRVANSRYNAAVEFGNSAERWVERQTQQNEGWKSERARYYIISTDLYNHIVLQTIYFRLTGSKYSLKSQILEYIIFPLCNCLS